MDVHSTLINDPPRPAATVVLLRDGEAGLEVFLVKRHGLSDVLGGAYVFPGGKLDPSDLELSGRGNLDQSLDELHRSLNEPQTEPTTAGALYIAALREAFEESGVLLALGAQAAEQQQAAELAAQGVTFAQMLKQTGLRLATRSMLPWVRWITPPVPSIMNRRFDTRFFVSAVPTGQVARHDNHEAVESAWLAPRQALQQYWDREIELAPPQIMSLAHLARYSNVAGVIDDARRHPPPVIQPEPFDEAGARIICYPGDPSHSSSARAMPGPTRLCHREGRFEPVGGFEALFE